MGMMDGTKRASQTDGGGPDVRTVAGVKDRVEDHSRKRSRKHRLSPTPSPEMRPAMRSRVSILALRRKSQKSEFP